MKKTKDPALTMLAYAALAAIRRDKEEKEHAENRHSADDDRVARDVLPREH